MTASASVSTASRPSPTYRSRNAGTEFRAATSLGSGHPWSDTMREVNGLAGRRSDAPGARRPKWLLVAGVAMLVVVVLFAFLMQDDDGIVTLDLGDIPAGVSARVIDGEPVFLVRADDDVRVLLADTRHLPDDTLWWCPDEAVFVGVEPVSYTHLTLPTIYSV